MINTATIENREPGMDSANVLARFEAERQALAMKDHANIAKVFEAGSRSAQFRLFDWFSLRNATVNNDNWTGSKFEPAAGG